ncbi:transposase [uncultured Spirosoma sp.]|uniref:transposase n=1 Tax=uncultured Spirosoma sp. TaxID=278208 RepID=UPI002588FE08|nr:transposase [uncultured Spirosoma sp.]
MSETRFGGQYRIDSVRLAEYDYGSSGMYFVTACTRNKQCCLGDVTFMNNQWTVIPSAIGQRVMAGWLQITTFHSYVHLDAFQLMPNHIHGILMIDKPAYADWQPNRFGPQRQNLGSIIRGFKSGVKSFATANQIDFAWQPRYYERVIRSDDELKRIRHYIDANPSNWHKDRDNAENLFM